MPGQETLIINMSLAVAYFFLLKTIFGAFGWLSQDSYDPKFRNKLDSLWDSLHAKTIYEVMHSATKIIVSAIQQLFIKCRGFLILYFVIIAAILNAFCMVLMLHLMDISYSEILDIVIIFSIALAIVDIISALITFYLLYLASKSKRLIAIIFHLFIDIIIVYLAIGISVYIFGFVIKQQNPDYFGSIFTIGFYVKSVFLFMSAIIIGFTSALPSFIYSLYLAFLFAGRFTPKPIKRFLMHTIYLITTDDKPVMSQLGTFFGGLAAGVQSIVALIRWSNA